MDESDPMLREFLQVMQPSSKRAGIDAELALDADVQAQAPIEAAESDDEYEEIPSKRQSSKPQPAEAPQLNPTPSQVPEASKQQDEDAVMEDEPSRSPEESTEPVQPTSTTTKDATDDEWLRSRTNRLLDLLDDDEPLPPPQPAQQTEERPEETDSKMQDGQEAGESAPAVVKESRDENESAADQGSGQESKGVNPDLETIRKTSRLFVRNLPYSASEDDLRAHFDQYGHVEEVRFS